MPGERVRQLRMNQENPPSYSGVPKTSTYQMVVRDTLLKVDPSGGAFTVTLPPVVETAGSTYVIRQVASTLTTTIVDKGDSLVAVNHTLVSATATRIYYSDGERWYLINSYS